MPVNHLTFTNVNISAAKGVVATDASDITFNDVNIITKDSVYNLTNAKNVAINNVSPANSKTFIVVNGKSSNISIKGKNAQSVKNAVEVGAGVSGTEVTIK